MVIPFFLFFSLGRIEEAYRHVLIDVRLLNYDSVLSCYNFSVQRPNEDVSIRTGQQDMRRDALVILLPSFVMIASLMQPPEEASRSIATAIQFLTNLLKYLYD